MKSQAARELGKRIAAMLENDQLAEPYALLAPILAAEWLAHQRNRSPRALMLRKALTYVRGE